MLTALATHVGYSSTHCILIRWCGESTSALLMHLHLRCCVQNRGLYVASCSDWSLPFVCEAPIPTLTLASSSGGSQAPQAARLVTSSTSPSGASATCNASLPSGQVRLMPLLGFMAAAHRHRVALLCHEDTMLYCKQLSCCWQMWHMLFDMSQACCCFSCHSGLFTTGGHRSKCYSRHCSSQGPMCC
jgi:hypothetical protein